MSNIVTRSSIVFLVLVISSCSTTPIPAWVEGKSSYYNTTDYLLGHGIGLNVEVAEINASLKITRQFKSVSSSDELSPQTNIIFNQIEFEQAWIDTDANQTHVLAYLSRNKAASFIYSKMLALDELTYQFFELAKETSDLLEQTSYIDSAVNAQTNRLALKPVLKIITSDNDIPSQYNVERLSKIRDQLQARINLQVDIKNPKDSLKELDFETIIKNSLDSANFIRNNNKISKNHLVVELKIDESPTSAISADLFVQGVLFITLQHQGDESNRGQYQWSFNATAKDHDSLIKKSQEILTTQLDKELKHVIMDMMIINYQTQENVPSQDYVDVDMPEFNANDDVAQDSNIQQPPKTKSTVAETKTPVKTESIKTEAPVVKVAPATETIPEKTPATVTDNKKAEPIMDKNTVDSSTTDIEDPVSTLPPLAN